MLSFGRSLFLNLWFNLNRYRKVKSISKLPYLKFWPSHSQVCHMSFFHLFAIYKHTITTDRMPTTPMNYYYYLYEKPMLIWFKYTIPYTMKMVHVKERQKFFVFVLVCILYHFSSGGSSMRFQFFDINNRYINRWKIRTQFVIGVNTHFYQKQKLKMNKIVSKNFYFEFFFYLNLKWFQKKMSKKFISGKFNC